MINTKHGDLYSRAKESIRWYGTQKQRPYRIKPETWEQILLVGWLHRHFPDIWEVTYSNNNGLEMKPKTKNLLKSAGLKPGVPDLFIAWPVWYYHGMYIEMKRPEGGRVSKEQHRMCEFLRMQNYFVAICPGFQNAAKAFLRYLYVEHQ